MADTVVVGKSVVRTDAAAKARGGAMYGIDDWGLDKPMPKEESLSVPIEDLAHDRFIVGNAEECRDDIERHARTLGVNHFIFRVQWPGMPQEDALGQIAQLGTRWFSGRGVEIEPLSGEVTFCLLTSSVPSGV